MTNTHFSLLILSAYTILFGYLGISLAAASSHYLLTTSCFLVAFTTGIMTLTTIFKRK